MLGSRYITVPRRMKIFILSLCLLPYDIAAWNITVQRNPGYDNSTEYEILYLKALNETSSVHGFISASKHFSMPSVVLVHASDPNSTAQFDWTAIKNGSYDPCVKIKQSTQSYALVMYKLLEYADFNDQVNILDTNPNDGTLDLIEYDLSKFKWHMDSQVLLNDNSSTQLIELTFNGTKVNESGHIVIKFRMANEYIRDEEMPRLQFVPGLNVHLELVMANLTVHFNSSRFAIQLALLSNMTMSDEYAFRVEHLFSIDDELTPGNFDMMNVLMNENNSSDTTHNSLYSPQPGGYLQIKPICYTNYQQREIKTSRDLYISKYQRPTTEYERYNLKSSIINIIYGIHNIMFQDTATIRLMNISFGTSKDGFYDKSKLIVWSASFGLGYPPVDVLSTLIVGLIALSVLIVLASLLFGSITVYILHRRQRAVTFNRFTNNPVA